MFSFQMTSTLIVVCALFGTTLAAIYIGDNQRIDGGVVRSGPYEDIIIGGRPNYASNGNRYPTNGNPGITIRGKGNKIDSISSEPLPPGVNLNNLLAANLPGGNRGSYGSNYQPGNNNNGYQPPRTYNSYPGNGRGGIVIGNGVTHRGGISSSLY